MTDMKNDYDPDPIAQRAQVVRVEQGLAIAFCLSVAAVAAIVFCTLWLSLAAVLVNLPFGH